MRMLLGFGFEKSVKVPVINQLVLSSRPALEVLGPMLYEILQATHETDSFVF